MNPIEISVVIPVFDEEGSLEPLYASLAGVLGEIGRPYEILFIDDGSRDGTLAVLEAITAADSHVRAISFRRNFGKAAALSVGFREARGEVILTMDGDLQDDPEEIPGFLEMLAQGYDLVSGWKRHRRDPISKRWPSRFWNVLTAWVTGIPLHDFNCGFKAYRREAAKTIRVYGELHRYLPVLADRLGFRVGEREVRHHPRCRGASKYGGARFLNGFLDLLTVVFLGSSQRNPLHVFGRIGIAFLTVGLGINLYMAGIWLIEGALRVRPMLIFGVIMVILGIQFISMGLLAEMIANAYREGEVYPERRRLPAEGAGSGARRDPPTA
ncbi:MAG: glycosyltransferase family 2 protein [Candidatus Eisenbacteria sp.]|nr:glycosyltransferase family 2 protein [Candidatus Eisenbacteria bacterium]